MKLRLLNPWLVAAAVSTVHANTLYFDGGTVNIATDGNGAGAGLAGTWNSTLINWDQGAALPHVAWDNSAAPGTTAVFGGPMGNNNRAVTVGAVNAVDLVFTSGGTLGTATRWTLQTGTLTLGDSVSRKASIDASGMLAGSTVGVNIPATLAGDVSGGLTLIGSNFHGTTIAATPYSSYFNGLNPTRVNVLSLSNLGTNSFTGPVTITNALEIQGLAGSRYKALGPATNSLTLSNGTILLYNNNGILDQSIAVSGLNNALNLNNNTANSSVSGAITSGAADVLWSVAGTTNGRLTYTGDLSGFTGTFRVKSSATGATVLSNVGNFGGTIQIESGSTLWVGNNNAAVTLGGTVINDAALVFNRSDDFSYGGGISGAGVVTKQGGGVLTLSGASSHTGLTSVTAGRLNLTGSLAGDISLAGGSTISGTGSTTGTLVTAAGSAIAAGGGAATAGLNVKGVDFSGPTSLDFVNAPVPSTVYEVLTYGAGGAANTGNFASFVRGTLNHDLVGQKFTFTAGNSKSLTWQGGSGIWDQVNTASWDAGAEMFYDWDAVTFGDPAGPATVTLAGVLRPSSVVVNNAAGNDSTFTGTGSLAGATGLSKSGNGTLVLNTANSHTGFTAINGGTLRLENASAGGTGAITIGNATLSLARVAATTIYGNAIVSATGTDGLLTVDGSGVNAGSGNNSVYTFSGIQVDGTLTVTRPTGGNGTTQYNGVLSGGGTLVVGDNNGGIALDVNNTTTNRGRVFFANTDNTFNGHVHVLERGNFLNNTVNPTYVTLAIDAGGAISLLDQGAGSVTTTGRFNGAGSVARNTQSGQAVLAVGGANQNDSFTGIIDAALFGGTGTIGFTKDGIATQTLAGAGIRHNGTTTANRGILKLVDTTAWASAIVLGATDSPVLEFAGTESYIMNRAITGGSAAASLVKTSEGILTLSGVNTFTGSISVEAGTLRAGNNQAFGANGTTITVANGAAIDTGGTLNQNRDYHAVIRGSGIEGAGAIINSNAAANPTTGFRSLTLAADATIGGVGRWDVRPIVAGQGLVDLAGNTLTKTGTNFIGLVNSSITDGTIEVNQGTLALTRNSWTAGTIQVSSGATLAFENNTVGQFNYGMDLEFSGATINTVGANVLTAGALGLSGASQWSVAAGFAHTHSGAASGTGGIEKIGDGTLVLSNASSSYTGATTVTAGTLLVTGALGATAVSVGGGAALGGGGIIGGSVHFDAGANLIFSAVDTLVVNGSSVTFGGFGVANLLGLDASTPEGIYTLIDGAAGVSTGNLANVGFENRYSIGDGTTKAYFEVGSLKLHVIPEPATITFFGGAAAFVLLRRRRNL